MEEIMLLREKSLALLFKREEMGRNAIKIVLPVPGMITLLLSGSYVQ